MAFYIKNKEGQILTSGGYLEVGEGLRVEEGELKANKGVDVDEELKTDSPNPVQNQVITQRLQEIDLVTAAALNDLNDKKVDRSELKTVAFTGDYYDLKNRPEEFVQQQVDWNATSGVTSIANKPNFKTVNGESIIGSGNIEVESGGGTIDNIEINGILGEPKEIDELSVASVTITGADIDVTGFTESEATNEDLLIRPTDSVNDALGKLQKAIKDDEAVHTTAFNAIKNATGFTTELEYLPTTDEGLAIYGAKDLSDADEKLAAALNNIKTLHEKVNILNIIYRLHLPLQDEVLPQTSYNPHYTGSQPINRTITLLGEDLLNLTRLLPPASWIDVQEGETNEYYTVVTASRTIAEKNGGILPMNPGIIYTWLENGLWVAYQYVGIDNSAAQFRNTDNWIKRW